MKIKPEKIKESTFRRAASRLPRQIQAFETGNFDLIGSLCQDLCSIDEFCGRSTRRLKLNNESLVRAYRDKVYSGMVALVLSDGQSTYKFSRKDLVKYLRGEFLHGDSDNRDAKRLLLHNFVFEEDDKVDLEYAITWSFVIFPGGKSSIGNTDSNTPFIQDIKFEDREIQVTQIESIIINAAYEYWQSLMGQSIPFNKVAITNDLDAFVEVLGSDIVQSLKTDWGTIQTWLRERRILL